MDYVPITREGYERLKKELERLQKEERPKVIKAIEEARGHGDLSENAEYEAAKEKQALIEAQINDLSDKLSRCRIVEDFDKDDSRVTFGCVVVVEDLDSGTVESYRLVGPYEAKVELGTISITSPIGQALLGKEVGEEVKVKTPKGIRNLEIVEVHWNHG
ncbi:MAG: transcription elongation factor GreA [Deltaproteobacteria bacterium]|nr:transcription elongation factor GreA [Deltaproteobacteria bacterium]MBW2067482.1 transcription elongation factor GreA [Deltaproteobacteria bacterium]